MSSAATRTAPTRIDPASGASPGIAPITGKRGPEVIRDDGFARLLSFPNVLVTGHQALFTAEALQGIAATMIANISSFEHHGRAAHEISVETLA